MLTFALYEAARHRPGICRVLEKNGRELRQVAGQLAESDNLATGRRPGVRGAVFVALPEVSEGSASGRVSGFVSVEYWGNRPGQLHGLAVDSGSKQRGIASTLVRRAEEFVWEQPGRGVYADPRFTNETARSLYQALGYALAYTIPDYYDDGLDGASYLKLFST